jgi:AcrR family transcriptional regulator
MSVRTLAQASRRPAVDGDARERLLHAAIEAFAELGYEGTSLREIAERAGVGFQLIAYYFGSKDDLWLAAVEDAYGYFASHGQRLVLDASGDLDQQFREHLRQVVIRVNERPHLLRIFVQEALARSARFHKVLRPLLRRFFETVSLPFQREAKRLGVLRTLTAEESELILNSLILANLVNEAGVELLLGERAGSRAYVERQVDLLARVLR